MTSPAFDTHAFVKRLTTAGMSESQAEALADEQTRLIEDDLATKRDMKALETTLRRDMKELETTLKRDMKALETTLKHDMKALETTLKHDMKALETTLKHDIAELKRDMTEIEKTLRLEIKASADQVKAEILKWMFVAMVGQTAVLAALIRLL